MLTSREILVLTGNPIADLPTSLTAQATLKVVMGETCLRILNPFKQK